MGLGSTRHGQVGLLVVPADAPGKRAAVSAARGLFPLGLGWQALASPLAIRLGVLPRHLDNRVVRQDRAAAAAFGKTPGGAVDSQILQGAVRLLDPRVT